MAGPVAAKLDLADLALTSAQLDPALALTFGGLELAGLKLGLADTGLRWGWIAFAGGCMVASGALLLIAQKTIPMGSAYAVWTGIGAVGTFALGIMLFSEPATLARFFFVGLIVIGIVGLKMASA